MQRFADKVVVVTGAGSGIGKATAERFLSEGAMVTLVGRTRAKLEDVAKPYPEDRVLLIEADISNDGDVRDMISRTVEKFGRLDVLVNNAGVVAQGDVSTLTTDAWRTVMATDVDGVFYACRAAVPHLKSSRGSIINVNSVSGTGGDWGMAAYNAAKGAITNLTRAMAMDHGKDGIRVNAVCPSLTRTGMTEDMMDDEKLIAKFNERFALRGPGEPEDVAAVIAFLASDDARFVTGVNLPVDGGMSASNGQPPQ
ncbi:MULTISPECIES: SDR family oxidoreductase [Rhizobium/Agrobacterium group]|uniref:SDR family NAD(P)-dependent oxidoreductase n=1 Tax=Rhizobium/Agrobacterium group TaxID=227290 RepID=UPI000713302B|nr:MULTISPECIES: SDR family oxidoreductase [Rhizobium/Agrobacterium group]KQQ50102.1 3-oxoacyl-ACP reductase [Rhizobium sp. Leaf311]